MRSIVAIYCFIALIDANASICLKPIKQRQVISFGPGVHELRNLCSMYRNVVIEGKGPGVTILRIRDGIHLSGANPVIRNMTIVGNGKGVGLHLENTWSALVENVRIQNYATGILFELTERGRNVANNKTKRGWPYDTDTKKYWGSRITLSNLRNVSIHGPGNGIVLKNRLKKTDARNYWWPTNDKRHGEFMNTLTIWGGHIAVRKIGLLIGDGVYQTKLFGTYIDASEYGGIVMQYGARGLFLFGVSLDPNATAKRKRAKILVVPRRSVSSVRIIGSDIKRHLITIR